jgi:hypothetical protein
MITPMKHEVLKKTLKKLDSQLTEIDECYAMTGELASIDAEVSICRAQLMALIADVLRMARKKGVNSNSGE